MYYKNSTYNTNIILNQVYLLNATVRIIRSKKGYTFNKEILDAYIRASIELNIFILIYTIYLSNLAIL